MNLAQQLERHRNFLQSQQRWLVGGFISILVVASIAAAWFFGKTIPKQIDAKVIEYSIVDQLDEKFSKRILLNIKRQVDDAKIELEQQASIAISEAENDLKSRTSKLIEDAIQQLDTEEEGVDAAAKAASLLVLGEVRKLSLIHPGMILPFVGEWEIAESLKDFGWEICDGRDITSKVASPEFQGMKTPNLIDMFLKGGKDANIRSGSNTARTTSSGEHAHGMPKPWYDRSLDDGSFAGIDTLNASVDTVQTQSAGRHEHSVLIEPLATSVIYLIRVR